MKQLGSELISPLHLHKIRGLFDGGPCRFNEVCPRKEGFLISLSIGAVDNGRREFFWGGGTGCIHNLQLGDIAVTVAVPFGYALNEMEKLL